MASTEVRPAHTSDVPAILPMVREYWVMEGIDGFDPETVSAALMRLLSDGRLGAGFLALWNGKPVAYLLAVYVFSLEHLGLTAEIDEFYVLADRRGRGVGTALLRAAEAEFARVGCSNSSLQIAHGNEAAREFYGRHGYRHRDGFGLMEKCLTPPAPTAPAPGSTAAARRS